MLGVFLIGNKYEVGKTYRQSNKKDIDQFTTWLNIQDPTGNSGVGNAQSIAPAYYVHRDLNILKSNQKYIPAYLVIVNNENDSKYPNFILNNEYIYHWGDSKAKYSPKHADDSKGNQVFRLIYELISSNSKNLIPPILYFDKPKSGELLFKGLCVLEKLFLLNDFEDDGVLIPNYLAKFKFTRDTEIEVDLLHQRARSNEINDILNTIPEGIKYELDTLKDMHLDNSIDEINMNDYLKIKGDLMENNNIELNKDDSSTSNTLNSEISNNLSCWLLAIDTLDTHFSRITTDLEISYEASYSSGSNNDITPQVNDLIIGYLSSPKLLKYVFKVTDVSNDGNDGSIKYKKLFETSVTLDVESISKEAPITYSNITSTQEIDRLVSNIPYDEFNKLIKLLLESLSTSLFKFTLDIELKDQAKHENKTNDNFDISKNIDEDELNDIKEAQKHLNNEIRNKIIYGAPGTGKSHYIDDFRVGNTTRKGMFNNDYLFERVTFHPSYTYGQFVGTYKPSPIYSIDNDKDLLWFGADKEPNSSLMNPHIDYTLISGPFLNMLCKALNNPEYKFLLIIEEMNRANAAAVFGDVFQLLDRNTNNSSTYSIKFNADITNFLINNIKDSVDTTLFDRSTGFIKIPENLFIWGTMNSADEGVSKMDSAFKRRWSFKYTDINPTPKTDAANKLDRLAICMPFLKGNDDDVYIKWNDFREKLNDVIYNISPSLPEDKYIGPFFLKDTELLDSDIIKSKLLLYLKDDVLRHSSSHLFKDTRFSKICANFESENIFKPTELADSKLTTLKIDESEYNNYENLKNLSLNNHDNTDVHDNTEA